MIKVCSDCGKEVNHLINNLFCHTCYCRNRYKTNNSYKESTKISNKKYRENNIEKVLAKKKEWEEKNRDIRLEKKRIQKANRRAYYTSLEVQRNAQKISATPEWLSKKHKDEIEAKYIISDWLSEFTGIRYHVDHIVPLLGKTARGLHVPWNLQVILAEVNMKKHNKVLD